MSKIDDLVRVYCDAFYAQRDKAPAEGITQADRAGIAAVGATSYGVHTFERRQRVGYAPEVQNITIPIAWDVAP